jgi:hypothetical protein
MFFLDLETGKGSGNRKKGASGTVGSDPRAEKK